MTKNTILLDDILKTLFKRNTYFSKTGKTLYYAGRRFQSLKGMGFKANYVDVDNGDEFWISGPKKDRNDRLYGGQLGIEIDEDVKDEYFKIINGG